MACYSRFTKSSSKCSFICYCCLASDWQNRQRVHLTNFASYTGEGVVGYTMNETWGYVCYDNFTKNDADTVCRQLGYSEAKDISQSIVITYVGLL